MQLARDYGTHQAGGDPPQLRHAAPCRRRHRRAHHRLPAGAGRRLARCRPAASCSPPRDFYKFDHAALERPDLLAGRRPRIINHVAARRRAHLGRAAGEGAHRLQQQSGRGVPGIRQGDRRLLARGSVHRGASTTSRPTPPTTPTSCCRRRRSSSTTTCTSPTATSTCSPTIRRSRRSASRCRTPKSSAASPRAWASTSRASATATRTSAARALDAARLDWDALKRDGWQTPRRARALRAVRRTAAFPTPSGKCEFYSALAREAGHRPAAVLQPAGRSGRRGAGASAIRSPSSRRPRATSSTPSSPTWRASASSSASRTSTCTPTTRAARGIGDGDRVRVFNDRGSYTLARARQRQAAPRRGGRALGMVEEVRARRRATPTT